MPLNDQQSFIGMVLPLKLWDAGEVEEVEGVEDVGEVKEVEEVEDAWEVEKVNGTENIVRLCS